MEEQKDYLWEEVPVWSESNSLDKNFAIMNDNISGRIPVTRLESWRDLQKFLDSPDFSAQDGELVFRGQRRYNWDLAPTLARIGSGGDVSEEVAEKMLELFRLGIRGRLTKYELIEEDDEL